MISFSRALVTGATSGIGEQFCHFLAAKKIPLIVVGRNEKKLEELKSAYPNTISLTVDLTNPSERKKLLALIHEQCPDLVINDAGFGLYGHVLDFTTEQQMGILQLNAMALLEISIEAARSLVEDQKKGTIFNVGSAAAFFPFPAFTVYAASKAFVKQFSEGFDFEMAPKGIRILCGCPGQVNTKFRDKAAGGQSSGIVSEIAISKEKIVELFWEQIQQQVPVKIFDWRTTFLVYFSKLFPKKLVKKVLEKNVINRKNK